MIEANYLSDTEKCTILVNALKRACQVYTRTIENSNCLWNTLNISFWPRHADSNKVDPLLEQYSQTKSAAFLIPQLRAIPEISGSYNVGSLKVELLLALINVVSKAKSIKPFGEYHGPQDKDRLLSYIDIIINDWINADINKGQYRRFSESWGSPLSR